MLLYNLTPSRFFSTCPALQFIIPRCLFPFLYTHSPRALGQWWCSTSPWPSPPARCRSSPLSQDYTILNHSNVSPMRTVSSGMIVCTDSHKPIPYWQRCSQTTRRFCCLGSVWRSRVPPRSVCVGQVGCRWAQNGTSSEEDREWRFAFQSWRQWILN